MTALPQGTVTFLFTDIEGSTRLLHELGEDYGRALDEHRRVLREAFARHGGVEVDTQGDAFFVAFAKASDALAAAADARDALAAGPIRVRIGLHTGEPKVSGEGYVGIDVHRAARIAAAGHGGQILVSQATRDLAGANGLRDLGEHRLKDLAAPERIYQLGEGEFPPLKSLNNSNLPLPAEPLLGRKKELADVLRSLREGTRLLTVTGPGGIGKTRFALDVAAELIDDFSDGVWWVGLAPVRDPRLVLPTITAAVGAKDVRELSSKRALLLLDNFEQVIEAAPDVAELRRTCPEVTVLATSREPLHVGGEREYPLAPLAESPAAELLRQRAEAMNPAFAASYDDLVQLCDRLDRLPLAIELAAARTKTLSVQDLLDRLDRRLPLLTSRRRDVEDRQRTLRATIEWSYDLLTPEEQELFRALSVFVGSFDAGTAEEVCAADVDRLESLVDKSLLRTLGNGRLFMFETVREYAHERLAAHEGAAMYEARLAEWVGRLADSAVEGLRGEKQAEVLEHVAMEHPHIRSALAFAIEVGDSRLALSIAGGLGRFWVFRGHDLEGYEWLRSALELAGSEDDRRRYLALFWYSVVADGLGEAAVALEAAEAALELARRLGDDRLIESGVGELARRLISSGRRDEAMPMLDEAERLAVRNHHVRGVAVVGLIRGQLLLAREQPAPAVMLFRTALENGRAAGDVQVVAGILAFLALAETGVGNLPVAREAVREALEICRALQHAWGVAMCLDACSALALAEGDAGRAGEMLLLGEVLLESIGVNWSVFESELHDKVGAAVRAQLSAEELGKLRQALQPRNLDEAISFAHDYLD
jgi:predicted ATPase